MRGGACDAVLQMLGDGLLYRITETHHRYHRELNGGSSGVRCRDRATGSTNVTCAMPPYNCTPTSRRIGATEDGCGVTGFRWTSQLGATLSALVALRLTSRCRWEVSE